MNAAPTAAHTNDRPPSPSDEATGILPRIALAALVALQITLILTHVAWRDELQAVMLAEHSPSLAALFANLHYEGHPALWYLLLRALSPLGSAPTTLKIVQLCVALATIALSGPALRSDRGRSFSSSRAIRSSSSGARSRAATASA